MQKSSDPDGEIKENEIKRCADCGASKTPLWRGGPAGPKVYSYHFDFKSQPLDLVCFSDHLMIFCSHCVMHVESEIGRKEGQFWD